MRLGCIGGVDEEKVICCSSEFNNNNCVLHALGEFYRKFKQISAVRSEKYSHFADECV